MLRRLEDPGVIERRPVTHAGQGAGMQPQGVRDLTPAAKAGAVVARHPYVRAFLIRIWESVNSSYWFPPAAMTAAAIGLAVGMLYLDASGAGGIREHLPWVYSGGAEGAREVLGTVAGSMMTVLSVTFSVTIVALTVASQQYGAHVLHSFVAKPGPQVVLGSFIGTFVYSLIVLRTVTGQGVVFVPHLSVSVGVILATVSIVALIYFIHYVSAAIQSSTVIGEIAADLERAIDRLFPEPLAQGEVDGQDAAPAPIAIAHERAVGRDVTASRSGYIQAVDDQVVLQAATRCDVLVELLRRPGEFVMAGEAVARVTPGSRLDDDGRHRVEAAILIGARRTPTQDVEFGFSQLLEIALHALSPAMNQPYLAVNCLDRLIAALSRLAERRTPSSGRYDGSGTIRVIAAPLTFVQAVTDVFDTLLVPLGSSVVAASHLLRGVSRIAPHLRRERDREALARLASMLHEESRRQLHEEELRRRLDEAYRGAIQALPGGAPDR